MCLLQASCLEILCLRAALRYDSQHRGFPLREHKYLTMSDIIAQTGLEMLLPLFNYAVRIQELSLDDTETALLAATLCFQVLY